MPRAFHGGSYKKMTELLVRARHKAGLSQVDLGERIGQPQTFVSKIERGERRIDLVEFLILCSAMGADPHDFIDKLQRVVVGTKF